MPPRPIHRWKSFWLGLLIITFLAWAWSRSRGHTDHLGASNPTILNGRGITSSQGYLYWVTRTSSVISPDPRRRLEYSSSATAGEIAPWFPPPTMSHHTTNYLMDTALHGIAHWLITISFTLAWSLFILWRAHHMRRPLRIASSASHQPARST